MKILGTACGLGVEGSGWVAGDGVVVTNAHVVAGPGRHAGAAARQASRGSTRRAIAFDPRNDIAVLRVEGLDAPALPIADSPGPGTSAAILGFPGNGPYDVRAGRLGQTRTSVTQDAYGNGPVQRRLTSLRGVVRSGNSGGPMVDGRGRVVTTIFAATTSGPRGGYGVPNAVTQAGPRGRARARRHRSLRPLIRALQSCGQWPRRSSSPRSRPSGATSRACSRAPSRKQDGYLESDDHVVTWAVGHLVQLAEPDEYDPKFKKWKMADLPIVPDASGSSCATSARASR